MAAEEDCGVPLLLVEEIAAKPSKRGAGSVSSSPEVAGGRAGGGVDATGCGEAIRDCGRTPVTPAPPVASRAFGPAVTLSRYCCTANASPGVSCKVLRNSCVRASIVR